LRSSILGECAVLAGNSQFSSAMPKRLFGVIRDHVHLVYIVL
jgi:hypothetical protein